MGEYHAFGASCRSRSIKVEGGIAIFSFYSFALRLENSWIVGHQDHSLIAEERFYRAKCLAEKLGRNKSGHARIFDDEPELRRWEKVVQRNSCLAGLPDRQH